MKGFRPGKGEEMLAKKAQEEQEARKKEFLERREGFVKELEALTVKYKIAVVGVMEYRRDGAYPMIAFLDDPEAGKESDNVAKNDPVDLPKTEGVKLEQS